MVVTLRSRREIEDRKEEEKKTKEEREEIGEELSGTVLKGPKNREVQNSSKLKREF